ncbi:cytochrome b/b6 domain-containing protein [Microbacterium sp. NPDC057650]|uniref:cytochrome b/b6 domain-containing protein n=1 Tax=unclassified Microbacterium TaxID=2609290 RepID=UPI00366A9419
MSERMLRRGLPRVKGGEAWPPAATVELADAVEATAVPTAVASAVVAVQTADTPDVGPIPADGPTSGVSAPEVSAAAAAGAATGVALRRGLPRLAGGEPWPPATVAARVAGAAAQASHDETPAAAVAATPAAASSPAASAAPAASAPAASAPAASASAASAGPALRRGLPRVADGDAWPPAGTVVPVASVAPAVEIQITDDTPVALVPAASVVDVSTPLPFTRTVWAGKAPRQVPEAARSTSSGTARRPTWTQAIAGLFAAAGLGLVAISGIFLVRAFLSLPFMQDFLTTYPGHYETTAAPGIPGWVGWQHFFNMFLMLLIIRSGLRVRTEKRPTVFWAPRGNAKGKISLTLWFHQSLDILWLVNGVIFVVLLFASGHWLRIVPTSWEVFPNALSALLQYVSFDWPTENGWNNYNSLQLLAYFTTVFIAAPLAAITGFRMSGLWPKKAEGLSKAYPVEWARALHFPIMLYFVAFIVVHVALVFLTGMLANLNHMFASTDVVSWVGFWVFVGAVVVMAIGWIAARPLVLAPIAKVFGNVSGR